MTKLFSFREGSLYCHRSLDEHPQPEAFPIHAHETPEIYLFLSGRGEYLVEGSRYPLRPGDLLLMRPAETHKLLIEPDEPYLRLAVHFAADQFAALDPEGQLLRPFFDRPLGMHNHYPAAQYPGLAGILNGLDPAPGAERLMILSRVLVLLAELSSLHSTDEKETVPGGPAPELVSYVNRHLFEPLSLGSVSRRFALSTSQVSRLFKEATGTSLWDYVSMKRLLSARARILRGDSAQAACLACGFADYSAFYRAYKKRFGRAPRDDR